MSPPRRPTSEASRPSMPLSFLNFTRTVRLLLTFGVLPMMSVILARRET